MKTEGSLRLHLLCSFLDVRHPCLVVSPALDLLSPVFPCASVKIVLVCLCLFVGSLSSAQVCAMLSPSVVLGFCFLARSFVLALLRFSVKSQHTTLVWFLFIVKNKPIVKYLKHSALLVLPKKVVLRILDYCP